MCDLGGWVGYMLQVLHTKVNKKVEANKY
jgi:hypothetical protein